MLFKNTFLKTAALIAAVSVAACGGSGTSTVTDTVGGTSGTLTAADGSPMAGATVAISSGSSSSSLIKTAIKDEHGRIRKLNVETDGDGDSCEGQDAIEAAVGGEVLGFDCTAANGGYTVIAEIPCGESITFSALKGTFFFSLQVTLTCTDSDSDGDYSDETIAIDDDFEFSEDCGIDDTDDTDDSTDDSTETSLRIAGGKPKYTIDSGTCDFELPNMAVVTGYYDDIQNVLAKLGYGEVDDSGVFDIEEDFDFTMIDGTSELTDSADADGDPTNDDADTYENFTEFVGNLEAMEQFDTIFINCGNSAETLSTDATVLANLQAYVEGGGRLYVTDWSYMFIEQPFPDFMDYLLGGSSSATAETPITVAKAGTGSITSDATVNDETMSEWLENVYVNEGDIEEDCYTIDETTANAQLGALNDDGTVTIGDFLSSWVVMVDPHTGVDVEPTVWIEGPITYSGGSDALAPLTVTQEVGDGEILYSSYHTAHSCTSTGFWPQERVLQYLVFEL